MPIGKEEAKISLFADGRTFYIRDSQNSTGKYFQLINNFSKKSGYPISQKSIVFVCTTNKHTGNEIRGIHPFMIPSKKTK